MYERKWTRNWKGKQKYGRMEEAGKNGKKEEDKRDVRSRRRRKREKAEGKEDRERQENMMDEAKYVIE